MNFMKATKAVGPAFLASVLLLFSVQGVSAQSVPNQSCNSVANAANAVVPAGDKIVGIAILTSSGIRLCNSGAKVQQGGGNPAFQAGACEIGQGDCREPSWSPSTEQMTFQWGSIGETVPSGYCNPGDSGCTWNTGVGSSPGVAPLVHKEDFTASTTWTCYIVNGYKICTPSN